MEWDKDLTGKALEIAGCTDSPLRVVAGPGTGKTLSLTRRVARLIEEGCNPREVFIVTFTRVAADDLVKEINKLQIPNAKNVEKGTLHSFCYRTLQRAKVLDAMDRTPRTLLDFEKRFLLQDLDQVGGGGINYCKRQLKAVEAAWARQQDQLPGSPQTDQDRAFQNLLYTWLKFHDSMLIEELIPLTLQYLRNNPLCPERTMFKHVLVDEYQDLNRADQMLIDILSEKGTLSVVGDEDQSIYEDFRYAHPTGISEFNQTHPHTRDIPLNECRRCPTRVVEIANSLININQRRIKHNITKWNPNCLGDIYIIQWENMIDEARGIAKFINYKVKTGEFDAGSTLIISPIKDIAYLVRDELTTLGCAAHTFFNEEVLDGDPQSKEAFSQQAFTLLTLLTNPNDMVALRCWLGFGVKKLRSKAYKCLLSYCSENGVTPRFVLDSILSGALSIPGTRSLIPRYKSLLKYENDCGSKSGRDIFDELYPEKDEWSAPFRQMVSEFDDNVTLKDILDNLRVKITQPELPTNVDYIRIMSQYKSKGLSADHVIIVGCINGLMPRRNEKESSEGQLCFYEEQRRLFYVAISRTRKTLVISTFVKMPTELAHRTRATIYGPTSQYANVRSSDFINELGSSRPEVLPGDDWLEMLGIS